MRKLLLGVVLFFFTNFTWADTATYSWRYYRPGNTGIQGDFIGALWIDTDGDPYIGGYDPNFEEGGFAKFIQSENRWINYSNVDYPVIGHPDITGTTRLRDIVQDNSGKLWMGTWRGAMRFDPAVGPDSIVRFGPGNSKLADDFVWDMDVAPDGTIWFANNGAVRYNPTTDTWTQWDTGNVFTSVQPKPGNGYLVWSSTRPPFQDYTFMFDSDTQQWTILTPTGAPNEVVGMPGKDCVDDNGNFWALRSTTPGNFDSLDYRDVNGNWITPAEPYNGVTFDIWAFKAYGNAHALLVDGNGEVWQFNGSAWTSLGIWRDGSFTYAVDIDQSGNVWVGGNGGAAKRDVTTGAWQRYRITNTSNFDSFNRDLTIDPINGYVYAGANAGPGIGGMVRFDGQRWTGWNQLTYGLGYDWPFPTDYCDALAYRPSNTFVAVSPSSFDGIHEWNGSGFGQILQTGGARRMCEDSAGRLWRLSEENLSYYDGSSWTTVVAPGLPFGSPAFLRADPSNAGNIWASMSFEFRRTDGTNHFIRHVGDFPGLTENSDVFLGLVPDVDGTAWVGATALYDGSEGQAGALIHIDSNTGNFEIFRSALGWPFPGRTVTPFAVTPDGRVWMQYDDILYPYDERGLVWYDGTEVGNFPAPPEGEPQWGGLPHAQIEDIEVRIIPGGYELWMSCVSRGIAVLTVMNNSGCPTITLSPSTLPNGAVDSAYSQNIIATGGTAPYTFAVTSGSLPDGLSLDSASGVISGIPTLLGTFNFQITGTDANSCTGSANYSITITNCLFCDDFEDGTLPANWSFLKPNWIESGGALQGNPTGKKAIAVAQPAFSGCSICNIQTSIRTAGGSFNKISMYAWYVDKKNTFELMMKESNDRWVLKQRIGGAVVGKAKGISAIGPNVDYNVELSYDGTDVKVKVDGVQVISYKPVGSVPVGTIGYTVKSTTGSFNYIQID
jgi:hypothetical protein